MFKSIFGSLIGAAAGLGVQYGIQQATGDTYIWFPVVIGTLTGLVAHVFAGKATSNAAGYTAGFFAGVIALAAIFGFDFLVTLNEKENDYGPIRVSQPANTEVADSKDADGEPSGDQDADVEDSATDDAANDNDQESESEDESTQDSDSTDESGESADENLPGSDAGDAKTPDFAPPVDLKSIGDRGKVPAGGSLESQATKDRFEELVGKKSHETWYDMYLPYLFSGIGVLMAYQLARGFGGPAPKE